MTRDETEAALNTMDERDALRKRVVELEGEVERLTKERNDVRGVERIGISTMPCVKRLLVETNDAELADAVVAEVEALQERVNDHREEADVMYDRYKRVVVERDKVQAEASRFRSALVAYAHHGHWDNEDEDAPYRRCFVWLCHDEGADEPLEYGGTLAAKALAGESIDGEEKGIMNDEEVVSCDECGHPPAVGNVVYEDSGRRPLCPKCNPRPGAKEQLSEALMMTNRAQDERDAALSRAEKAEMDRDAARRVIHEERILTHEALARATAAEAREAGLKAELDNPVRTGVCVTCVEAEIKKNEELLAYNERLREALK
jgi:hypothetical protein